MHRGQGLSIWGKRDPVRGRRKALSESVFGIFEKWQKNECGQRGKCSSVGFGVGAGRSYKASVDRCKDFPFTLSEARTIGRF